MKRMVLPKEIYRTGDLARMGEDGLVYFLGRADSQIKHRGYRIELGEIEAALNAIPSIRDCVVVGVSKNGFEGTEICCAFSPQHGLDVAPAKFSTELRKAVPAYMIPTRWMSLDQLPKNSSGKLDRRALKERFEKGEAKVGSAR